MAPSDSSAAAAHSARIVPAQQPAGRGERACNQTDEEPPFRSSFHSLTGRASPDRVRGTSGRAMSALRIWGGDTARVPDRLRDVLSAIADDLVERLDAD